MDSSKRFYKQIIQKSRLSKQQKIRGVESVFNKNIVLPEGILGMLKKLRLPFLKLFRLFHRKNSLTFLK